MQFARKYFQYFVFFALVLVALGIWGAVFAATPSGVLTVAVLNVGQGDSIFVESPTGVQIIIDGGPDGTILSRLPTLMPLADRTIDVALATHPDADHIAGLIDLLNRYEVKNFIEPSIPKPTVTASRLREVVVEKNIPRFYAYRGMWLDIGGGAVLKVLSPDFDVSTLSSSKTNEGGIVLQLIYGSSTMLLMADVSEKVENHLVLLDGEALNSDILKVGHHGSRTSTSETFLQSVTPAAAIISVGASNKYGHPTQDVLDVLLQNNIRTLRTDKDGTIVFVSKGGEFKRAR